MFYFNTVECGISRKVDVYIKVKRKERTCNCPSCYFKYQIIIVHKIISVITFVF